jgi:hypothetical protein
MYIEGNLNQATYDIILQHNLTLSAKKLNVARRLQHFKFSSVLCRAGFFKSGLTITCIIIACQYPIQPPIQWVPGTLSPGESSQEGKLITYLHPGPRLKMHEAIPLLRHTSSLYSI